ncbi:GAF domain-containing sensor histidine kinase [Candidatus Roizmanbacteria bacterium]|nr:GAF domain-containing sensor histidine kinase [Candidatus Roizmanbacteria bacterium]
MNTQINKISHLALKFLEFQDSQNIYAETIREATALAGAEMGTIYLYENDEPIRVYSTHTFVNPPRPRGFTYQCYKEAKIIITDGKTVHKIHPNLISNGIQTAIFLPLHYKGHSTGVLILLSKKNVEITKQNMPLLHLLSSFASLAIEKNLIHEEIQNVLQNRDLFISMAAHEIRTPIATIYGYTQLMIKELKKWSTPTPAKKWSEEILLETERLKTLIDELLQVDSMKKGVLHYKLELCNMREIIKRSLRNIKFKYSDVSVEYSDLFGKREPLVNADANKIMQVLINILDNGIKHNQHRNPVSFVLKKKSQMIVIAIKDSGSGIDKSDLPHLFDGFYKATGNHKPGMGLGLYIARNIITKHGGTISISSKKDFGTTVTISLPLYDT